MQHPVSAPIGVTVPTMPTASALRSLTRQAFEGVDLRPLRDQLVTRITDGTAQAGEGLDLSLIVAAARRQAGGARDPARGAGLPSIVSLACCGSEAAACACLRSRPTIDMGGNTPIEFLLEESDIELMMLYVVQGSDLPVPLARSRRRHRDRLRFRRVPRGAAHDRSGRRRAGRGRCSIRRSAICNLDRDKLYRLLAGIEGLEIPATDRR